MHTTEAVCRFFERDLPVLLGAPGISLSSDVEVEFRVEGPGGGVWLVCSDENGAARVCRPRPGAKDCVVQATAEDFKAILRGRLGPMRAFVEERIRVEGDVGLLLQLRDCVLPRAA
jgi:predicted lipid carrier protein YhbT